MTATYDYDGLNRPTQITYPDETVTYAYDTCTNGIGRLCSISDKTGTTLYSYDFHGRVTNKLQVVDTISQSMTYEYNAAGQLGSITLPSGHKVVYTYDNNRPVSVAVDGQLVLDSVFYEPFGPNGGWRWGNSQAGAVNTHTRVFDQDFRATRVTSDLPSTGPQPYFDLQYGWDVQSRIQAITDASARVPSATYGYDALDRLNSVSQGTTSLGFTYDGIGGRKTSVLNGASTTYTYVAGTHRLQSLSGSQSRAFGYDAAGNMISDGGSTWTYGANNRPTQAGMMGVSINALGQRVKRTVSGTTQRFVYDESGRLWGEYDDQGAPIAETVWLGDLPVAVLR